MHLEVEQKFWIDGDRRPLMEKFTSLGAAFGAPVDQVDEYLAHPCRDFAKTDEALRIRSVGEANFITYKGPKLDSLTKTRHELELPIAAGDAGRRHFLELFERLGFRTVATVRKQRQTARLARGELQIELSLDSVAGLGEFVELEISADAARADEARGALAALAAELGLTRNERRSYLELLLDA